MIYCELISNLTLFTIVVATQQILLPHISPELEHENRLSTCMTVLLINIIVSFTMHIAAMLIGKFFLELKLQIETKNSLLDEIKEGVIVFSLRTNGIMYANKTAKKYL